MRKSAVIVPALILGTMLGGCFSGFGKKDFYGTWYEQNASAGVLTVTEDYLSYVASNAAGRSFESKAKYSLKTKSGSSFFETREEDYFLFVDVSYEKDGDRIIAHTWPHTDGDGGYHLIVFEREPYVAPAPIVYDPPADNSDKEAKRDFEDLTISSLHAEFFDAGPYHDPNSDMALPEPYADSYTYDLTVQDDGSALVSSSFCREISISADKVSELQQLADSAKLGEINGIDIHTPDLPEEKGYYTLELTLASGEVIRSSANGDNIPANWKEFQEPMHNLLYFAFRDAGYKTNGTFHSTAAMKRAGGEGRKLRDQSGLTRENVKITPDIEKSYDYSLETSYFVFSDPENRYGALMETLNALSEKYKAIGEKYLEIDHDLMEHASKSDIKKADGRLFTYSLFAVDNWSMSGNVFCFTVSCGNMNTLGLGDDGFGRYWYEAYCIDARNGKILTLSDFFVSPEAAADYITEKMLSSYGTANENGKRVHRDDFPAAVAEAVRNADPEGFAIGIGYDSLNVSFPKSMFPNSDSRLSLELYYDDMQDILEGDYVSIY